MFQTYIKHIDLVSSSAASESKKAVIRTKWNTKDDRVDFLIFIRDSRLVFVASWSISSMQKKNSVSFEAVKESVTSVAKQDKIHFELDEKKSKFSVVAQETFDTDASFGEIIYLKVDVTKLESSEAMPVIIELLDEMFLSQSEIATLEGSLEKLRQDFKKTSSRLEKLTAEKVEFDSTTYQSFLLLLNSKKRRIAELERKLQKSKPMTNKFANLSSDFDQSDVSSRGLRTPKTISPTKPAIVVIDASDEGAGPSTSAGVESPARKKVTPAKNSPRTPRTPRRTPRKARSQLFKFKELKDSDDSSDEMETLTGKSPRGLLRQISSNSSILDGMELKLTRNVRTPDEVNQSSAELFIPKTQGRSKSSSSEVSRRGKSVTPDVIQHAQLLEAENSQKTFKPTANPKKSSKTVATKVLSEELFQSDDEIYTQKLEVDADTVQNSQSNDSPSIFESYPKRKSQKPISQVITKRSKVDFNKSKFSVDTIDILADESG